MIVIRSKHIPFKGYDAINLCGCLFCHPEVHLTEKIINHEKIHTCQMVEMLVIPFYLWYVLEWLIRLPLKGRAYKNIAFEQEAYRHMDDFQYLSKRRHYAWLKYLLR